MARPQLIHPRIIPQPTGLAFALGFIPFNSAKPHCSPACLYCARSPWGRQAEEDT